MYNNTKCLEVGKDFYNLKTGEYVFSYVFDGKERFKVEGVPETFTEQYGSSVYISDVYAYVKGTDKVLSEDDVGDICYNHTIVSKERYDEIEMTKKVILNIIEDLGINEPFVYENGKVNVGKEHVLSAHIQAGYDQGWISSSICW